METAEWFVFGDNAWEGPYTLDQLDEMKRNGKINDEDSVTTRKLQRVGGMSHGLQYGRLIRRKIQFIPSASEFHAQRKGRKYTALSGANNSGKSLLLKQLKAELDSSAYYLGCNRIYQIQQLTTRHVDYDEYKHQHDSFMHSFYTQEQNWDENARPLDQILTGLSDDGREKLFDIASDLLGGKFSLKRSDPGNSFSTLYLDLDGLPAGSNSTGTRLLLTMLGACLDSKYNCLLIDEPEMGFSPRLQNAVAKLLSGEDARVKYFPHLECVYVATHSPLFLDRHNLSNNYTVTRSGSAVSVSPVSCVSEYNTLQFDMLGSDLETLFLPSAILLVEGKTDVAFIKAVLAARFPHKRITVVNVEGDGMESKLRILKEAFGEWEKSPYKERVFVIMDKVQSQKPNRLSRHIDSDNIIIWSVNGVEYLYPTKLLQDAFSCDELSATNFTCSGNTITINGITKSKDELCNEIMPKLASGFSLHPEMESKLINRLSQIV